MNKAFLVAAAFLSSASAFAESRAIEGKGYYTRVHDREVVTLDSQKSLQANYSRHIALILEGGGTESHWCAGSNILGKRALIGGGGSCVALDEDGDAYWLWFEVGSNGFEWEVMKGVGKFEGATGSGTARVLESLVDGSGVFRYQGTIELPDG